MVEDVLASHDHLNVQSDGRSAQDAPAPGASNVTVDCAALEITSDSQRIELYDVDNDFNLTHEENIFA